MEFKILQKASKKDLLYILDSETALKQITELSNVELGYIQRAFKKEQRLVPVNQYDRYIFIYFFKAKDTTVQTDEMLRKTGAEAQALLNRQKLEEITISNL